MLWESRMRRRIIWRYGDSPPIFGHLICDISACSANAPAGCDPAQGDSSGRVGDGELKITVGFPVSAAEVAFSKIYNRYLVDTFGYDYQNYANGPEVYVGSIDDDGFTVCFRNIPDTLDINYFVM
jgi:hypothetical protein